MKHGNSIGKKRTKSSYINFQKVRNRSTDVVREAKMNYEKSVAEEVKKGDSAVFYAYARSRTTIKDDIARMKLPDGSQTLTYRETAEVINKTFQSVFVREGDEPPPSVDFGFTGELLEDVIFDSDVVFGLLSRLKESSAPGPCGVHPKVLNECAANWATPLYYIYRKSLDEGQIPEVWKTAFVTPIYKKGKKVIL